MLKIDKKDLTLALNRGDTISFDVGMKINGERYKFKAGDTLRLKVYEKKACNCVVIQKDFTIGTDSEKATISLTENETRVCGVINKPVDYWYEVEFDPLNNPVTIIGYDDNGPKIFRIFPEGQATDAPEILPEDIPVVDKHLDLTSDRPVENRAITKAVRSIEQVAVDQSNAIGVIIDTANAHYKNNGNPHNVTKAQVGLDKVPNVATNDQTPTFEQAATLERLQSGEKMSVAFGKIGKAISDFIDHLGNKQNPHGVTKGQVGLGNADNTADIDKPVSTAQEAAIADAKKAGTDALTAAENAHRRAEEAETTANGYAKTEAEKAEKAAKEYAKTEADTAFERADAAFERAEAAETTAKEYAKGYADSLRKPFTVSLPASGWSGTAPYTQTVSMNGILGTDTPHWGVVYSSDKETALKQKESFSVVDDLDTADGSVTFSCLEEKPEVDLTIQMEVNR